MQPVPFRRKTRCLQPAKRNPFNSKPGGAGCCETSLHRAPKEPQTRGLGLRRAGFAVAWETSMHSGNPNTVCFFALS